MGHVDVSDQLRNYYRFDHYMRKRKWWWSLAFWGIGVQFVNAYVVYCKVMEESGVPRKDWLSHYDFRKSVALEWINEKQEKVASKRNFVSMVEEGSDDDSPKRDTVFGSNVGESGGRRSSARIRRSKEEEVQETVKRSVRVTDSSLHPDGALNKRLQRDLFHWPKQAKQNQRCTLHRWASNVELKDKVLRCTDCEVHLCVNCYKVFHMVPNLVDKKDDMCKLFLEEQKERAKMNEHKTPESQQATQININLEELLNEALTSPPVEI
jgi:hypothetical protein